MLVLVQVFAAEGPVVEARTQLKSKQLGVLKPPG